VKVLDFGLARAFQEQPASSMSQSPTLLSASIPGVILGTAAYMSPEQARGRNVDRTTDVWAFGCVLYEMLTRRPPFEGEDVTEILGRIVTAEPDWRSLPAGTPLAIEKLLRRALRKNPRQRLGDIRDARIEIEDALAGSAEEGIPVPVPAASQTRNIRRERVWIAIAGVAVVAFAVAIWAPWRTTSPPAPLRLSAELGADVSLATGGNSAALALSPDGNTLAFAGVKEGIPRIYIRSLGQLQATPLPETAGAKDPFFSPDGQWLAFFATGKLKKIAVSGGAAVTLADAVNGYGGSWGDDGNIAFTPNRVVTRGVQRVSSAGGKVEPLTKMGEGENTHRWPQVLPGAKAMIYMTSGITGSYEDANIVVQPMPSGPSKVLIRGGYYPQYVASGHLVYIHDATLYAAPFDLSHLEVIGQSVPVVKGIRSSPQEGVAQLAFSQTGALAYLPGDSGGFDNSLVWMSHDGSTAPLLPMPSNWSNPEFSPDGRRLAVDILSGNVDLWIYEMGTRRADTVDLRSERQSTARVDT